ncbi:MAG: PspC domain-containing protein [Chloroflexi bacterium]|nr:PspC domain-containing protein [Chloroflexota bacterium]
MHQRRLERSSKDRVISCVCGGLAEYLAIDATLIRVFFVILTVVTAFLFLLVCIAPLILTPLPGQRAPIDDTWPGWRREGLGADDAAAPPGEPSAPGSEGADPPPRPYDPAEAERRRTMSGWAIVAVGAIFPPNNLGAFRFAQWGTVWPLVLIAAGVLSLASDLGHLPAISARALLDLWPVILIVFGIEALVGRRQPWLALGLEALVMAGAIALAAAQGTTASRVAPRRSSRRAPSADRCARGRRSARAGRPRSASTLATGVMAPSSSATPPGCVGEGRERHPDRAPRRRGRGRAHARPPRHPGHRGRVGAGSRRRASSFPCRAATSPSASRRGPRASISRCPPGSRRG